MAESFIKIPTDVMEALYSANLTKNQLRILLYIIRKTIGWRKKWDSVSVTQAAKELGARKQSLLAAVSELEARGIVAVERVCGHPSKMAVSPVSEWQGVTKSVPVTETAPVTKTAPPPVRKTAPLPVTETAPQPVTKTAPTIDNTDTITDNIQIGSASFGDEWTPEEEAKLEAEGWF